MNPPPPASTSAATTPSASAPASLRRLGARLAATGTVLALALPGVLGCGPEPEPAAGKGDGAVLRVVASIPPLAGLVERLGGDRVEVRTFIPPGASPHAFEPSPRQVAELEEADLVVEVGHPDFAFERQHLERLAERRDLEVVRFIDGLATPPGDPEPSPDGERPGAAGPQSPSHGGLDPHVWVAPAHVRLAAGHIAAALSRLDPAGEAVYRARLADLLRDVDEVDRHLRESLAGLPRRSFVVQHPSWGHLAAQYGLEQVSIEEEGKEPSPQHLVELIRQARRDGTRVIFVQPGVSAAAATSLAAEVGAEVRPLDPLARDWVANLYDVADALHEALRGEPTARGDAPASRPGESP